MGFTSVERGWQLKWQTQELRRHDSLAGYVYSELYDIVHEQAGLLMADRLPKDLANISPADVNAETVLVLDVLPHHGAAPVRGRLRWAWGPHLGFPPGRSEPIPADSARRAAASAGSGHRDSDSALLIAEPFVLSEPVQVTAELPHGWVAGRLHVWLENETGVLATTGLDVVRTPPGGTK